MSRLLAIDLFCGLGGWTEALLEQGYKVIGFDIERHQYGKHFFPGQLVIQDVLTLHGAQFRDAALIVASPPCQKYSYMAMPWTKAKALAKWYRDPEFPERIVELNALFDACFRIQREACEAAGHHIPLIVENVRGAQPWVGRARWSFGSYYLWGDIPALMPICIGGHKIPGFRFDGNSGSFQTAAVAEGFKSRGLNWSKRDQRGNDFTRVAGAQLSAATGRRTAPGNGTRFTSTDCGIDAAEGRKGAGAGAGAEWFDQNLCQLPSSSPRRKAASAMIAKIPAPLARHIATTFARQ